MHFGKGPRLEQQNPDLNGSEGVGGVATGVQSSTESLMNVRDNVELPPEAIITLADGVRVVSQNWLAVQLPPQAFMDAGGEVFDGNNLHLSKKMNKYKMQCWSKNGIWYWNMKGGEWLAEYYKGKIPENDALEEICEKNRRNNINDTMDVIGVARVSGLDANGGERLAIGYGIIRSAKQKDYNGVIIALFNGAYREFPLCYTWLLDEDGAVPFFVLNSNSR